MVAALVAAVAVASTGAAVARPGRAVPLGRGVRRLAAWWAGVVVAGCVWELFQFVGGLADPHGSWWALSDLLDPLIATGPGQALFAACWAGLGVWLPPPRRHPPAPLTRPRRPAARAPSGSACADPRAWTGRDLTRLPHPPPHRPQVRSGSSRVVRTWPFTDTSGALGRGGVDAPGRAEARARCGQPLRHGRMRFVACGLSADGATADCPARAEDYRPSRRTPAARPESGRHGRTSAARRLVTAQVVRKRRRDVVTVVSERAVATSRGLLR